jgi:cullin-associated NEDD8-dissociated protein 1
MNDFSNELSTAKDDSRKCLALAILGEIGLRMGAECALTPEIFIAHFDSSSDHVRLAAATALGNAAAGSVKTYLPVILNGLDKSNSQSYLLLHSVRELLQHPEVVRPDLAPTALKLWQSLLVVSEEEDNRAVGAECVGRLALIDPVNYIPHFRDCLSNSDPVVRGVVISAFRYTLADSSDAYNDVLRPLMVPLLTNMLSDSDLGNHRLALTTLNSAIHNKMNLLLPHLGELLPAVFGDTQIKPELIREVQMGPFKHKVDDGLDLRKVCSASCF